MITGGVGNVAVVNLSFIVGPSIIILSVETSIKH